MKRQDLEYYLANKEWIKDRMKEIEERKEIINKLTASYGHNTGGSSAIQDRVAEGLVDLLDKTDAYVEELKNMEIKQFELVNTLDKLDNKIYRNILYKKYILGISIEEISENLEKDYKYTCTLHGYALKEFKKICEKMV